MFKTLRYLVFVGFLGVFLMMSDCTSEDIGEVADCNTPNLAISTDKDDATSCLAADGMITVSATGGKEPYTFTGNGETNADGIFTGLAPGTYAVKVKDANGCEKTEDVIILDDSAGGLVITPVVVDDTDCFNDDGSITVNVSGGTGPITYQLGTGTVGTNNVFSGLEPGNYIITVRDASNCPNILNLEVGQGDTGITYSVDILPIFNSKCNFGSCHPTNGNLSDYMTAKNIAAAIKSRTGSGNMPKGGADAPGGALSTDQIALIACWVNSGAKN